MISFNGDKKHIRGKSEQIRELLKTMAKEHSAKIMQLDYTFVDDETLLQINKESLKHDFYTDIISFDYSEDGKLEGDIYISIDRVKENAVTYNEKFHVELLRVIFHGALHLMGYKDKTKSESKLMREKENLYINKYNSMFHVEQNL